MIRRNNVSELTPGLRVLSNGQLERIHLATLEVLRRTGVSVLEEKALSLLKNGGAEVSGERVFIPAHLVEWAIRAAPPTVALCTREGRPAIQLESDRCYYGTGSDTPNVIDPYTGERRGALKADIANVAKVCDYLPNIDFVMCMGIASDVLTHISDIHHFMTMVSNTQKPIVFTAWNLENLKHVIEMAEAVAGGPDAFRRNPFVALYAEPISPLQHALEGTEKLLFMAEKRLPIVYTPAVLAGATGPVTLAGTLVQGNAELLSGLVIAQLKSEGTPFIYGGAVASMDMSTSSFSYASPEFMLATAALTDLAHHYGLPMFSFTGCSDSKVFDEQAALEGTMWILWATLTGGNLIHDVGYIESGLTASFEMLVMCDEIIAMVKRMTQGLKTDEDALAVDVIDKVGPGGNYLTEQHTVRHCREQWFPELIDRGTYEQWKSKGEKTLGQRVNEKVRKILETHISEPLNKKIEHELWAIMQKAEKAVSDK